MRAVALALALLALAGCSAQSCPAPYRPTAERVVDQHGRATLWCVR